MPDALSFLLKSAWQLARHRGKERTQETVRQMYDLGAAAQPFNSFDEFVYGTAPRTWIMLDGVLKYSYPSWAHRINASILYDLVKQHTKFGSVIEFGCGTGRNLLDLGMRGITNPLIGLDLSMGSIRVAQAAAKQFDIPARFLVHDVTEDLPRFTAVDVVFSVFALEMMPRVFTRALDNIRNLNPRIAIFIEPISELWPWTLHGMVSRLRVRQLDRLRDSLAAIENIGEIIEARMLPAAHNALNPGCLVVLKINR